MAQRMATAQTATPENDDVPMPGKFRYGSINSSAVDSTARDYSSHFEDKQSSHEIRKEKAAELVRGSCVSCVRDARRQRCVRGA